MGKLNDMWQAERTGRSEDGNCAATQTASRLTHTHTWRGDKGCHDDPLVTVATQLFVLTKR